MQNTLLSSKQHQTIKTLKALTDCGVTVEAVDIALQLISIFNYHEFLCSFQLSDKYSNFKKNLKNKKGEEKKCRSCKAINFIVSHCRPYP